MYLQDPIGCERRVPYKNPHILPPEDEDIVMTDFVDNPLSNLGVELLEVGPDLLAELVKDEEALSETEPSSVVTTPLFSLVFLSTCHPAPNTDTVQTSEASTDFHASTRARMAARWY